MSVYRGVIEEFSAGDRIQFTAPDKSLGVANRDLAVIESVAPDGLITVRLDNNRRLEFDTQQHRHSADAKTAVLLKIKTGSPVVRVRQVLFEAGVPVVYSTTLYRSDRHAVLIRRYRKPEGFTPEVDGNSATVHQKDCG